MRGLTNVPGSLAVIVFVITTSLAQEGPNDDLVPLVVSLLHESDKDLRSVALEQVRAEAKGEAATRQFAAELPKLSPETQAALLDALAERGDMAARPAILEFYSASSDDAVKAAAIAALGPLGEPSDVDLLVTTLKDAGKAESAAAESSLVRLQGESVPSTIAAWLKHSAAKEQITLVKILTERRATGTVADILPLAMDADPKVRAAAMTALGQLAAADHMDGLVRGVLAAEKGPEREAAEKALMLVCNREQDEELRAEPLLASLSTLEEAERLALLPALGRVGGQSALAVIEEAIADQGVDRHAIGLRALCNWPHATIAERLVELVREDAHPEHRTMALRALIRVAPLPDKRSDSERLELLQRAMALCQRNEDRIYALQRARAIRTVETLRFVAPYMDQEAFASIACETVVELAHHRNLREPNKAEFHAALDKVIATSQDSVVVERANRYKRNQTWARPKPMASP